MPHGSWDVTEESSELKAYLPETHTGSPVTKPWFDRGMVTPVQ